MPQAVQLPLPVHLDGDERRPQAGSLLVTREEFSFVEGVTIKYDGNTETLPQPHPADRDYQPPTRPSAQTANEIQPVVNGSLNPKQVPLVGGVRRTTLLFCAIQLISLGGTIAIWVFATIRVKATLASNTMGSLAVFIHVAFVILFLGQLVFLQRAIHRLRRERYRHLRPGEVPPPQQHSRSSCDSLAAIAPWNQPHIPIYRPALPHNGVATGDVENNPIAISPPPPYAHMRENTLPHLDR